MNLPVLADDALSFANEFRAITGLEPAVELSPGSTGDCAGCPIARTAGGYAYGQGGWHVGALSALLGPRGGLRRTVQTPKSALDFMAAFDAGMFPDLTVDAPAPVYA